MRSSLLHVERVHGPLTPLSHGLATYSHLNPHLNPHPNSVPFTRPSRKSSLVMQAALFHVTRVRDASAVFAKLLQLLLLFSGCEQEDDGGFELSEEDYRRGIMRS